MAEHHSFFPLEAGHALEAKPYSSGITPTLTVRPGTGHTLMAPHDAFGTHDTATAAKVRPEAIGFLKSTP